jgi:iron complex outermembrane recepter protein
MTDSLGFYWKEGAKVAVNVAALLALSGPVLADSNPADNGPAKPSSGSDTSNQELETITVTGIRRSLEDALSDKRNAPQVLDAISAEDIGKFPDKDMGEALQRVTGVQITRSSGGEGSTVTIRGADPTMTRVEINGTAALSLTVGASDRAVDFRDLPVEFVKTIEVIKSPTADMVEGGVGGTVRVTTRRPFDTHGDFIAGSVQGVYSNLPQTYDPQLALIGSKLFFDDTFGALISGTFAKDHEYDGQALTTGWVRQSKGVSAQGSPANPCGSYFGSSAPITCGSGYTDYNGTKQGDWYPQIPRYLSNRRATTRDALSAVLEYRPADGLKFFWDVTYANAHEDVDNQALQLNDGGGIFNYAGTTVGADNTVSHIVENSNGSQAASGCSTNNAAAGCLPLDLTFRNILGYLTRTQLQTSLGGSYDITPELSVDMRYDYSGAKVNNQETDAVGTQYGTPGSVVDYTGSLHAPDISLPGTDLVHGSGINDLDAYYVPVIDRTLERAFQANLTYKPEGARWLGVKTGLYTHNYQVDQSYWGKRVTLTCRGTTASGNMLVDAVPCSTITSILGATGTTNPIPFYNTGNLGFSNEVRTWLDLTPATINAVEAASGVNIYDLNTVNPNSGSEGSYQSFLNNWTVGEKTIDGYAQFDLDFRDLGIPLSGNVGWRQVHTDTSTTGFTQVTCATCTPTVSFPLATITGHYKQGLPAANLKLDIIPDRFIARFAAGKVMARPAPSQLAIGRKVDIVGLTGSQGNPNLLPFVATDYDAGLEWYSSGINYLSMDLFEKDISRFIQNTTQPAVIDGVTYSLTYPVNGNQPVKIRGIEAGLQYGFEWLPGPLSGFGVLANATYQTDHGYNQRSLIDGAALHFPGLSRNAYNASIFYEKFGISTRLSYVWRSSWLINATGRGNLPEFNSAYGELDLSASYEFLRNFEVFFDAINLTDSQLEQYNAPQRPIMFDTFGSRYFLGVRFKY